MNKIVTHGVTFQRVGDRLLTDVEPPLAFEAARRSGLRPIEAKRLRSHTEVTCETMKHSGDWHDTCNGA